MSKKKQNRCQPLLVDRLNRSATVTRGTEGPSRHRRDSNSRPFRESMHRVVHLSIASDELRPAVFMNLSCLLGQGYQEGLLLRLPPLHARLAVCRTTCRRRHRRHAVTRRNDDVLPPPPPRCCSPLPCRRRRSAARALLLAVPRPPVVPSRARDALLPDRHQQAALVLRQRRAHPPAVRRQPVVRAPRALAGRPVLSGCRRNLRAVLPGCVGRRRAAASARPTEECARGGGAACSSSSAATPDDRWASASPALRCPVRRHRRARRRRARPCRRRGARRSDKRGPQTCATITQRI